MERSDYEDAIQWLKHARAQMRHYEGQPLLTVSLASSLMAYPYRNRSLTLTNIWMEI